MSQPHRLRVHNDSIAGLGTEIYLDDEQMRATTSIDVHIGINEPNRAVIGFICDGVGIEMAVVPSYRCVFMHPVTKGVLIGEGPTPVAAVEDLLRQMKEAAG